MPMSGNGTSPERRYCPFSKLRRAREKDTMQWSLVQADSRLYWLLIVSATLLPKRFTERRRGPTELQYRRYWLPGETCCRHHESVEGKSDRFQSEIKNQITLGYSNFLSLSSKRLTICTTPRLAVAFNSRALNSYVYPLSVSALYAVIAKKSYLAGKL
jgi:hypothetical protein